MRCNELNMLIDDKMIPYCTVKSGHYYPAIKHISETREIFEIMTQLFHADKMAEEHLWIICINSANKIIGVFSDVGIGNVNSCDVFPMSIFSRVLICNSPKFILVHNHPSGHVEPSYEDLKATEKIELCAQLFQIEFLDHIIIGKNGYRSIIQDQKYIELKESMKAN